MQSYTLHFMKMWCRGSGNNRTDGVLERQEMSRKEGWISCRWKRSQSLNLGRLGDRTIGTEQNLLCCR